MDYKIPEKTRATQGPHGFPRESPRLVHNAQLCCLQKRPGKESELRPNCVFADAAGKSRNQVSASSSLRDLRLLGYHQNQWIGLIAD
jgi:hypothetical protein